MAMLPIERLQFNAADLIRSHPPLCPSRNKRVAYDISRSCGCPDEGTIAYCRWSEITPPRTIEHSATFTIRPGVFDYVPEPSPNSVQWHMNFADPSLFVAYDSSLLAQDELQVAEHPVLGSLRDALIAAGKQPRTVDRSRRPTPITITGVQRRCWIDTLPNPQQGRPHGLYGNQFARASVEQVRSATKAICPPTISNILAIAAPACGHGAYSRQQITDVLSTAYSGFSAARAEGERLGGGTVRVVVHTGFWGCGAFGGNRTLMTVLQALAADLACVHCTFHAFDAAGVAAAEGAQKQYTLLPSQASSTDEIVDALLERRFAWGQSDGN